MNWHKHTVGQPGHSRTDYRAKGPDGTYMVFQPLRDNRWMLARPDGGASRHDTKREAQEAAGK